MYVPSSKHVIGDPSRRIQRLPSRFYGTLSPASDAHAEQALAYLFSDNLDIQDTSTDHLLDWEQLYRVSTNWQDGNFAISQLLAPAPERYHTPSSGLNKPPAPVASQHTIVRVSNNFILTAATSENNSARTLPSISVYPSEPSSAPGSHAGVNTEHLPKDLHNRTPLASFSSPALHKLLSQRSSDTSLAHLCVTEIAVDAAATSDPVSAAGYSNRKRKASSDQEASSRSTARVLVAYSTGHISLFSLLYHTQQAGEITIEAREVIFHTPSTYASGHHVAMAALHSPALVLCSSTFDVSFYQISTSLSGNVQLNLLQRMSSYRSSWPAALRLKKLPFHNVDKRLCRSSFSPQRRGHDNDRDEAAFRVTLAYSTPSYPSSWSVSVQELVIRLDLASTWSGPIHVASRHATAKHPFRPTPIDLRGRSMLGGHHTPDPARGTAGGRLDDRTNQAVSSAKGSRTTSLTYDDPFVVVGASDNLLEVYELLGATTYVRRDPDTNSTPPSRSATATPVSQRDSLRLIHRRSLHGHTGSVHSVALEDGRCVSGSADGSVMVWSLGDCSNETDSIASMMRTARATARGHIHADASRTGTRSTSSTIMEEEEAEEAASHMTHVLTLRTPIELNPDDTNQHHSNSQLRAPHQRRLAPSLAQLVRSRVLDRQARGVIRWVSTAFDKIVSIVAYTDTWPDSNNALIEPQYPRERVQIWSFG